MTTATRPWDDRMETLLAQAPEAAAGFRELYELVTTRPLLDPVLLELCRLRSATLLGVPAEHRRRLVPDLDETLVEELPRWPGSSRFDDRTRAAVRYTESFLLGTDQARAELDGLRTHFDDREVFVLTAAVSLHECFHRLCLALGAAD